MSLDRLLLDAAARGVTLQAEGDSLRVRAPKGALTEELKEALTRRKAEILSVLRERAAVAGDERPIARIPRDGRLRLSFAQQRIWFLDQLEGGRAIYHVPACAWLDGPLDVEALRQALVEVVRRHETLRTTFVVEDGEPAQRIGEAEVPLVTEDVSGRVDASAEAERRAAALAREPFDLARGPLLRGRLVRTAPERHVLALSFHHIVADAWSMGVLLRELAVLYEAAVAGRSSPLAPIEIQYADFAAWQRERLAGERRERLLAHWRSRLAGAPDVLELPWDRPRPAVQSFSGAIERFEVDAEAAQAIRDLAGRHGATLFQALLAVFQALLHRYSGQDSIAVGSPIANRGRSEVEPLIGFFVNTLVLRADLSDDPTFLDLLERVKTETLEAFAHQELPFETLVAELAPARSLSQNPLFQAMFALQNAPLGSLRMGGVRISPFQVDLGVSKFDLYLSLEERADGAMAGEWEYATDLFEISTVRRMIDHFRNLLREATARPDARISRLPLMGPEEVRRLVVEWNRTEADWPRETTLVDLVAEQAARTPESVAVVDARQRLTYAELDRRANRLANHLRRLGVGTETFVGVCVERTADMVTAVLGVLKAGGAYVPLDPAYPGERVAFMVEDAGMPIIVTHATVAADLPAERARLVRLDADLAAIDGEAETAPAVSPRPEHLAYVIYTSGSTGRPKGILIEHGNAVSLLAWARTVFAPEDLGGTLAATSLCFDLSVFELFLPLAVGGTVIVAENALALPGHPAAGEVTLLNTVPSAMAELLRTGGVPPCVRIVNLAGEPLKASLVDRIYALGHVRHVYDLYGPGETTTYSTVARRVPGGRESVGRPIANTRLYILDREMRPVPVGVPGEIYIGGPGVTRGYLNRDELTRERYLPDPFGEGRVYRTGDLGRFFSDGEVQYLGRIDNQVKIRGFRIELGEIESVLGRHDGVRECVVHARADGGGDRRLVAYYAGPAAAADVRAYLQRQLPPFMLPSAFIRMDALPMTPNGKIDRKALPPADAARLGLGGRYVPPGTGAEETLCRVFSDVLRLERVGAHDNFFEIGGDSILAIQIVSRAREAGLLLTPPLLFQHQTVADLASAAGRLDTTVRPDAGGDEAEEIAGEFPLTPIQRWCLAGDPPSPHHFAQWLLLDVPPGLEPAVIERALGALVEHHAALRLRFRRRPDGWQQWYGSSEASVAVETADAGDAAPDLPAERHAEGMAAALDLERGPLVRAALLRRTGAAPQLLLAIHHLVVDGVSWRILCEDLVALSNCLRRGDAPALPARTSSFRTWAERFRDSAPAGTSVDAVEPLPRDLDAPGPGTYAESRRVDGSLGEDEAQALLDAVPKAYRARADEALLAALGAALAEWSGRPRQVIDVEGHGRDVLPDLDVSRTVGWFTTIRPVAFVAEAEATPGALLKCAKEACRAALRGGTPGGPRPEISFNYLGQLDQALPAESGWSLAGAGLSAAPARPRSHSIAFAASIRHGRLSWEFRFGEGRHARTAIERLSGIFARRLSEIVAHCQAPGSGGYTPSDFPGIEISPGDLDALVQEAPAGRFHRNVESIDALSPAQEGILFHSLLARDGEVYVTQIGFRLEGPLDRAAFRGAWETVTARHAALRTCVVRDGGQNPLAVTLRRVTLPFAELDWRPASDQEGRLKTFLEEDRRHGLDLASAPLMRVTLVRLGEQAWACVWTSHHAILDGWSLAVVMREVAALYEERVRGVPARLPAARPYRDHVRWLARQETAAAETFWREELGGWSEPLDLPFGRVEPSSRGGRAEHRRELPAAVVARVKDFARRHHLTLHTVLQGAWALLLARYGDREDVLFGGAVSGRATDLPGIESAAGLFSQTVPVRVTVPEDEAVVTWLERLQARHALREAHAHLPLVRIQEMSGLPRGTPLFETLLVLENYPVDETLQHRLGDLAVRDVRVFERPHYPLTVVAAGEARLALTAVHDTARFANEAVLDLLERYERVIHDLAEAPDRAVGELSITAPDETRRVLVEWNATERPYPLDRTIADLFEEQVERTPDATAIVFEAETLTYAELDRRANRLAHHLQACGVGPDVLVGVCLERSVEMVVALYGVLKAGGAYVPIDPAYPEERRAVMRRDAGAAIVLDGDRVRSAAGPTTRPARAIGPGNVAYMIYTSGSTGAPKGALNTHAGILNRLLWMQEAFGLGVDDAVLQKTPFSFDVSVWEFFWPLLFGARLVVARPGGHLDRDYLVEAIERDRVTTIHFVPSMLQVFLDANGLERCRSLRRVIASGEALGPDLVRRFRERFGAELHNLYGPTEAAVDVTWWPCPRAGAVTVVPIGRPIANTRLYVLDRRRRPVPVGVPGELYIGGVQVGRGYWNRPELTQERFVADPFGPGRLYRTGDRGRFLADGNIEYLGRIDHQVKVRGVRIEPGEIEAALRGHPEVRDAVVTAREERGERLLVAYCTTGTGGEIRTAALREHLRARLPEVMVPSCFVTLPAIPRLPNGKVDRRALPAPGPAETAGAGGTAHPSLAEAERAIAEVWRDVLGVDRVGPDENFFDLGGHSLRMMRVHGRLQALHGGRLTLVDLFEHPTVRALARFLGGEQRTATPAARRRAWAEGPYDVAVIGMACRFPGARTVDEFWRNLVQGRESITFFSDEELRAAGEDPALLRDPRYVGAYGALPDADRFDAAFFDVPPREAEIVDPQQRVFLEVAWEAIEHAGYDPSRVGVAVGVFAGAGMNTYAIRHLQSRPDVWAAHGAFPLLIASDKDYLPTRVSYKLDLRGPSVSVQTACSTSLVAITMACESLLRGECGVSLAGGVTIRFPQTAGHLHEEGMIFSPDGRCRAFDARSAGMVAGSGAGVVVLKRLEDALADGDRIHAVIKGAAINNDGALKVGYTAPSLEGQARVIGAALERAGVDPQTIRYVEAHGTGTPVGDPIEVAALTRAWRARTEGAAKTGYCAIGSVKTNVGHLDAAAGVAGFIKAVLAVEHGQIPPSLHFESPNPRLEIERSPFFVASSLTGWPGDARPRRAAVSSFGIGGTNAHAILEEPPAAPPSSASRSWQVLALSARTATALEAAQGRLADALEQDREIELADAAYTLLAGRRRFAHRRAVVCRDGDEAVRLLRNAEPARMIAAHDDTDDRPVVFLFSGYGAQYPGMGRGLYEAEPVFREEIDRCAEILRPHVPGDVRQVMFGSDAATLRRPGWAQPALFVMEWALARLWTSWGVRPAAMLGHSVGEYAAACLAGVFPLEEALPLIAERGRLIESTVPGAMLAVAMNEEDLGPLLGRGVSLAVVTAPGMCVVSGRPEEIEVLRARCEAEGADVRPVEVDRAMHSVLMEPVLDELGVRVARARRAAPGIPVVSNVSGTWITAGEATDPGYWARHLRSTVRLSEGIALVAREHPTACFLEVGPGRTLASPVLRHPSRTPRQPVLTTLRHPEEGVEDQAFLLATLGRLWAAGVRIDEKGFHAREKRRRVSLPAYPFEGKRYLIAAETGSPAPPARRKDVAGWLYLPTWERSVAPVPADDLLRARRWLVLADAGGLGESVAAELRRRGARVTMAVAGPTFADDGEDRYVLRPAEREDYDRLFSALSPEPPEVIIHLLSVGAGADEVLDRGFYSLLCVAQAFAERGMAAPCRIAAVTDGAHRVTGDEALEPLQATVLGPVRVIPQEDESLRCVQIDLAAPAAADKELVRRIVAEADADPSETAVAYRNGLRWIRRFAPLEPVPASPPRLRDGGTYLVTGGLGGVGLELAEGIARSVRAPNLVLVSRTADEARCQAAVRRLETAGARVHVLPADVSDADAMRRVLERAEALGRPLDGVVHAAGIPGGGTIALRTREAVEREFAAKVRGTLVLHDLLRFRALDFFVLCSSTSAITGGVGSVAYTAANAFQDAFSDACQARGEGREGSVVAVAWDRWQGVGMGVEVERLHRDLTGETLDVGIWPDEGREAFRSILCRTGLARVATCPRDLTALERETRGYQGNRLDARRAEPRLHDRPEIGAEYEAPGTETEEAIAAAWREVLGMDRVGIHDHFAALGGDSLLAVRIVSRLRRDLEVALPVRALYEMPTVKELARHVEAVRWARESAAPRGPAGAAYESGVL